MTGIDVIDTINSINAATVRVTPGAEANALRRLRADPAIEYAEPDIAYDLYHGACAGNASCFIPNDPLFGRQWHLQNDASTVQPPASATPAVFGSDIDAPLAWHHTVGSAPVTVAVVDTGIDPSHPDLTGRVSSTATLVANGGDGTDYVGHGTMVAGIIGATWGNGIGVAGVSPNARLMVVKNTSDANQNQIPSSAIANAIVYATDHGANVINVSEGGSYTSVVHQATQYAWNHDALVVAAAGNDGNTAPVYPAADPYAFGVAATTNTGARATFSTYGSWVMMSAPGEQIYSTRPTYPTEMFPGAGEEDPYDYADGTSFSAPIVSGGAALVWPLTHDDNGDGFMSDNVVDRLADWADRTIGGTGTSLFGSLNLCRSVLATRSDCAPARPLPTPAPTAVVDKPAPAAPAAAPAPAGAPPAPTLPRIAPSGVYRGSFKNNPIALTIGADGRTLTTVETSFSLRCKSGRRYRAAWTGANAPPAVSLSSSGDIGFKAPSSSLHVRSLRFTLTATFSPNGTAHGTLYAEGNGPKKHGKCRLPSRQPWTAQLAR